MNRFIVFFLLLISLPVAGSPASVECAGVSTDDGKTRLILATTASVSHQVFTLDGPDRVVIDIADARLIGKLPEATAQDPTLIGLRSGVRNQGDLRIVLDLKHAVRIKSFSTPSADGHGHRLFVDLIPKGNAKSSGDPRRMTASTAIATANSPAAPRTGALRTAVIAIDAGHGGADPGAIGPTGIREKDVTLAIARKLASLVDKEPGMRALMIRDSDDFIGLRQRILKAREHKADIFISIHADAFNNTDAHGSSVYTLSNVGASSEAAMWLADRENSADLVGGVDISASDDLLATVLLDMTQNATIEHSTEVASAVLSYLGAVGDMHRKDVQRAGFVVLKSPDIPSLLVETAFISNADEEKRLKSNAHQQRLAQAILAGVKAYLKKFPPRGLQTASAVVSSTAGPTHSATARAPAIQASAGSRPNETRGYVVNSGDTLSGIAKRHRVSLSSLRAENGLEEGDMIRAGQVLAIPADS
ncbi:N-acetylmuramoyl-L-alanine amidase family protein [Thiocystis violascens]|uniref:N-acetylmuramoyl-L-alanine amidase AmiC n=1 Tax=Thiocystis violascens (strain ATCC 17096 / DSM 198 / 6111) TaxID=765911 RepID=I3YFR7_THIV6|nr:N-acetylmuramoyl-L-alanine amidase [Thiocystis violascens]AFL75835.1 N-acetylmuramoyl-L-alanine amidase [Thiocystis violascens DSM 198]